MAASEKRTFGVPAEQAAFIDSQVKAGSFASASEVVRAGLRALQARDAAIERWLQDEVVASYDRWKAEPEAVLSPQDLAEQMRRRHEARRKAGRSRPG